MYTHTYLTFIIIPTPYPIFCEKGSISFPGLLKKTPGGQTIVGRCGHGIVRAGRCLGCGLKPNGAVHEPQGGVAPGGLGG